MRIMISLALIMITASIAIAQERKILPVPTLLSPEEAFESQLIPRNSKVYISKFLFVPEKKIQQGFQTDVAAAMRNNEVPLTLVTDRDQADFEIRGAAYKKGGYISIEIVNRKTKMQAFEDSSYKYSPNRGFRSPAEKFAKYLKRKIEDDEKKAKRQSKVSEPRE